MLAWIKESKNLLIVLMVLTLIFLVSVLTKRNGNEEMNIFDPLNPSSISDSLSSIYKNMQGLDAEKKLCQAEFEDVRLTNKNISRQQTAPTGLIDHGKLTDLGSAYVNNYRVISIFSFSAVQAQNRSFAEPIYASAVTWYSGWLYNVLKSARIPNAEYYSFNPLAPTSVDAGTQDLAPNAAPIDSAKLLKLSGPTLGQVLGDLQKDLDKRIKQDSTQYVELKTHFNYIRKNYFDTRYDIRQQAISWGIVAFVLTALVLYSIGAYFRDKRFATVQNCNPNALVLKSIRQSTWMSVYMITVLLLIITIFILGLAGLLKENTLAALLGSLAGYVLNGRENRNTDDNNQSNQNGKDNGGDGGDDNPDGNDAADKKITGDSGSISKGNLADQTPDPDTEGSSQATANA